jgi:putative ABC transport system permease protein
MSMWTRRDAHRDRAPHRIRWQVAWQSLRWRAGTSLAMLVVAAAAIAVGTFGPIYLRGADQSVLQSTLSAAPEGDTGVTLLPRHGAGEAGQFGAASRAIPRPSGGSPWFGSPIVTLDVPASTTAVGGAGRGQPYRTDLVARTGACRHLQFASGGCPVGMGTVALSTRSAAQLGVHLGEVIAVHAAHSKRAAALTVTGLFRAGNPQAAFWWGENYFGFGSGSNTQPFLDDFFTDASTVTTVAAESLSEVAQFPLRPAALTVDAVAGFRQALSRFEAHAPGSYGLDASSQVTQSLDTAAQDEHTVATIVAVVVGELVLLALMVLYFVAARVAETRKPDVRVAELRGYSRAGSAWVALAEPLTLLVISLPLGVGIAWVAARLLAPHVFAPTVTPGLPLLALAAAVVTLAAGALATAVGARSLLAGVQGPRSIRGRAGNGRIAALAIDAVAVVVAALATVEIALAGVSSGSQTDPVAALAPALIALGGGVLGARLLPMAARAGLPATRYSSWVGTSVATRRLARRPEISRHVVVLALAVGLATFTVAGWAVAGHNRLTRSEFDVGAYRVLAVRTRTGVNLLPAVRRADPDGTAMAVVVANSSQGDTLAVDASRLASVGSWPAGLTAAGAAAIGRALAPPTAPSIVFDGAELRVTVDLGRAVTPAPELQALVFDDAYQTATTLDLGPLRPGRHRYAASTAGGCQASCRLVDLGVTWTPSGSSPGQSVNVPLELSALAQRSADGAWTPVAAGLRTPARWQSSSGGVTIKSGTGGLAVTLEVDADGEPATFRPADVPANLPAVVTGSVGGGPALAVGLDGSTLTVKPIATVNALPGVGSGATLVNLASAERLQAGPMEFTSSEVWLAAGAPSDIVHRLAAVGIYPVSTRSAIGQEATLARTGVSLAYALFFYAALAALALALGATAVVVIAAARRRGTELGYLEAVGVARPSLRRSLVIEQGVVVAVGALIGAAAGIGAAVLALPSIPEFTSLGAGPPLAYQLPLAALGVTFVAIVASLALTVGLAARLTVRHLSSSPGVGGPS